MHSKNVLADRPGAPELRWWCAQELEDVRLRLAASWTQWAADWLIQPMIGDVRVSVGLMHEYPASRLKSWSGLGSRGAACAWIASADVHSEVRRLLFVPDGEGSTVESSAICDAVTQHAWSSLATTVLGALKLDGKVPMQAPVKELFDIWSGSVLIRLMSAESALDVMINCEAASALISREPARSTHAARGVLYPVAHAMANRKLPLRIELSECEFDFGTLASLRVGDVIPLPHALAEPLHVVLEGKTTVCTAHLGKLGVSKAVELLSGPVLPDLSQVVLNQTAK